jgi:hypothetical protein
MSFYPSDTKYISIKGCLLNVLFQEEYQISGILGSLVTTVFARPQVTDGGEGLQIWRVAANILNKQSRTADKGWPSNLGVGRGLTPPHRKKRNTLRNVTKGLGIGRILWHDLRHGKWLGRPRRRWEDNIKMDFWEIGFGDVDWIHWAQDRDRWRALVNTVMNLLVL